MEKMNFYTPDGVQDVLYEECSLKRSIEGKLRELFRSYAYREIETPAIEYLEVFSTRENAFPAENMFKFFDDKGRVLVLKPDQTIPVARVAASKLRKKEDISKISYVTKTYRFAETGAGKQREFTQAGCELLNVSGSHADSEIIALAINSMLTAGISDFQIDIGQVDFFKGIMEESKLDEATTETIRVLIDKKDYLGLEETLSILDVRDDIRAQILNLPSYFGDMDVIDNLKSTTKNSRAQKALENLKQTYDILRDYGLDKFVSFDLGMVQSINYYTGIIFKGYTYGVGFPVLNGGRYDSLLDNFCVEMPAVGFSVDVNMIIKAVTRQNAGPSETAADTFVTYESGCIAQAYEIAAALRTQGLAVEFDLNAGSVLPAGQRSKKRMIPGLIYVRKDGGISVINNLTGESYETDMEELTGGTKCLNT